jgi:hypothetical protein
MVDILPAGKDQAKMKVFFLGTYTDHRRFPQDAEISDPHGTLTDIRRCYILFDIHVRQLAGSPSKGLRVGLTWKQRSSECRRLTHS